jgi:hypothetical protein
LPDGSKTCPERVAVVWARRRVRDERGKRKRTQWGTETIGNALNESYPTTFYLAIVKPGGCQSC